MAERTSGTLGIVADQFTQFLETLQDEFAGDGIIDLAAELGFRFPPAAVANCRTALDAAATAAGNLPALAAAVDAARQNGPIDLGVAVAKLVAAIGTIITSLETLSGAIQQAVNQVGGTDPTALSEFLEGFGSRIFQYLLYVYLEENFPTVLVVFGLFGIATAIPSVPDPSDTSRIAYDQRMVDVAKLTDAFQDPIGRLTTEYGWGTAQFDAVTFLARFQQFLYVFAIPANFRSGATGGPVSLDTFLLSITPNASSPPGLAASTKLGLQDTFTLQFPLFNENLHAEASAQGALQGGVAIQFVPKQAISLVPPSGQLNGQVTVGIAAQRPSGVTDPFEVLGVPGVGRLEADVVRAQVGLQFSWDTSKNAAVADPFIRFGLDGAAFTLEKDGLDSFTGSLIPESAPGPKISMGIGWSPARGVFFDGSAGFETVLPVSLSVGPFHLSAIVVDLGFGSGGLTLGLGVNGSGEIGPVTASVEKLGITGALAPTAGNLGFANLSIGLKFPSGIGIAVDAGPVSGGGFISFDPANNRYFGALELSVYSISVKAFAVIETKLPTGPGYSFLIIISAEFTPIQLGFGFTLNGVGGLIGINRSVDSAGLLTMIKTGQLDNVLFPTDVVDNAPAILNDLETLFPPTSKHYIFGPLAKIGWGTPTLVDGELGLIIEYPGPVLTIIGTVHAALPKQDDAVVELNLDVGGVLDFPNKKFSLDASLHDSYVGDFPITGDMAMRMNWGQNPNFAFSLGGFNPHYNPPAGFPKLKPVSVDLGSNGNPSIVLSGYMALTSNTAQLGAKVQANISKDGASISGFLGFDALFIFSPFSFVADIEGGVSASIDGYGISLDFHGTLSGPSPWHLAGKVCISLWFFSACADFSTTLGGTSQPSLPGVDPWTGSPLNADGTQTVPGLQPALSLTGNWGGNPPAGSFQAVTLIAAPQGAQAPIDPLGSATFRQKAVPLDLPITAFAGTAPSPQRNLDVSKVVVGPQTVTEPTRVTDYFAPGQYQKMKDADKLSSQSFVQLNAGFTVSSDALTFGPQTPVGLIYTDVTFAAPVGSPPTTTTDAYTPSQTHVTTVTGRSAAAKAGLRNTALAAFVDPKAAPLVNLANELYTIANIGNLVGATGFQTNVPRPLATSLLAAAAITSPTARQTLQVAPTFFVQPSTFVL